MSQAVYDTTITSLPLIHRGKVRDVYAIDDQHLLMIATDRVSAFDVILPNPMPGKGRLLTEISLFWFRHFANTPNHLADITLEDVLSDPDEYAQAQGRSMIVKRLKALPIEAVVRGYLIGSGFKDYQQSGEVCGIALPKGLSLASELDTPIFTPATKAEVGDHDENIDFASVQQTLGHELAEQVREVSMSLYQQARSYAAERGIIIADTKFEFGLDAQGQLTLMDEALTPDSSRFWPQDSWKEGISPPSFDKQFVRDYLETLDWNKAAPGPELPDHIIEKSLAKYQEALSRLMQ